MFCLDGHSHDWFRTQVWRWWRCEHCGLVMHPSWTVEDWVWFETMCEWIRDTPADVVVAAIAAEA